MFFPLLLQLHTFWVESDNYFTVTKPWFASRMPFPLSLILPGRMSKGALNRILLTRGEPPFYHLREVEAQVWLELPSEQGLSGGGTRENRDETIGLVKNSFGFFCMIRWYRKTRANFLACPILIDASLKRSSRASFLLLRCNFILIRYTEMRRSA